jgi:uncharacterized protein with GYD domain
MAKKAGLTMKDMYWTLGQYDVAAIFDAPDEAAATSLALSVGSQGNVRTQILRAFNEDEIGPFLKGMAKPARGKK